MRSLIRSSLWHKSKQSTESAHLNLEALMDIFTIILFFLLTHQSSMSDLPDLKGANIILPEGGVESDLVSSLQIRVSSDEIMIGDRVAGSITEIEQSKGDILPDVVRMLGDLGEGLEDKRVIVLGDQGVPFIVLHKLMASAAEAGFSVVSLVVVPV